MERLFRGTAALFLAALIVFSSAAFAASTDAPSLATQTAKLFLNDTEAISLSLVPFQAGGENYFIVKTSDGEQLLLHEKRTQNGTQYEAVEGAGAIESLLSEYRNAEAAQFDNDTLEQIKSEISTLNATYQYCAKPMNGFLNTGTLLYQILYLDDMGSANRTPYTTNAVNRIRGNRTTLNNGTTIKLANGSAEILEAGFKSASEAAALENAQENPSVLADKLNTLYSQIAAMKGVATEYSMDFAFLKSRHPEMLNRRDCNLSAQSFDALAQILESQGAVLGTGELAQKMAQSTSERKPTYEARKAMLEFQKQYDALSAREKQIEISLAPANVTPSSLKRKLLQLERYLGDLSSAENLSDARVKQGLFQKNYDKALSEAQTLSDNSTLQKIAQSAAEVREVKLAIDAAETSGGADPGALLDAKTKYQSLKAELDDALFWVEFGGGERLDPGTFQNLTFKAVDLKTQAYALTAKTGALSAIRPETILIPIIAIAAIAGIAYYYFKTRRPQGL